ncbi:unnamed protein product [Protopolystoma xenopodis]|uniref:Pinin/SDK/MemA protein domain-containing protein n=1 Tax=Protopolystoma xenopodis TaxID=117903 RepID=A0A3S5B5K2_9PLAT|nr:unnamed protein product [Protopolystoma xenopodis]
MTELQTLQQRLELVREQLDKTDSDIKRLTGRDIAYDKRGGFNREDQPPSKRANRGSLPYPQYVSYCFCLSSVPSSVVRVSDSSGRRMLGILQNTLNAFRNESVAAKHQPKAENRRRIDEKVEARAVEEKKSLQKERVELFRARREQLIEFQIWKKETEKMFGFIRTDHAPFIFFRPREDTVESNARKEDTRQKISEAIEARRLKMESYFESVSQQRRHRLAQSDPEHELSLRNVDKAGKFNSTNSDELDDDEFFASSLRSHVVVSSTNNNAAQQLDSNIENTNKSTMKKDDKHKKSNKSDQIEEGELSEESGDDEEPMLTDRAYQEQKLLRLQNDEQTTNHVETVEQTALVIEPSKESKSMTPVIDIMQIDSDVGHRRVVVQPLYTPPSQLDTESASSPQSVPASFQIQSTLSDTEPGEERHLTDNLTFAHNFCQHQLSIVSYSFLPVFVAALVVSGLAYQHGDTLSSASIGGTVALSVGGSTFKAGQFLSDFAHQKGEIQRDLDDAVSRLSLTGAVDSIQNKTDRAQVRRYNIYTFSSQTITITTAC